jgi:hypothetical protein
MKQFHGRCNDNHAGKELLLVRGSYVYRVLDAL